MMRFNRPDPYDGSYDPSNPQSLNRYSYVLNRPLTYTDRSGLECTTTNYYVDGNWDSSETNCTVSAEPDEPISIDGGGGGGWWGGGFIPEQPTDPGGSGYSIPPLPAPINVPSLINNAKGLLSQRCKSKFGQKIPGYTTSRFFNTLSNATINQYPFATPPQDASSYGADAVTHPPGGPIDLLPNFYGRDPTSQAFVLVHEGIHLFGRGNLGDSAVQNLFGLPVTGNTENITQYIAAGCYP
jgi:hypothetical protein